jgi:hypothetical protein
MIGMGSKLRRAIRATIAGLRDFLRGLEVSPGQVQALVAVLTLWFLWNQLGINTRIARLQEQQSRFALAPQIECSFKWGPWGDGIAPFFEIRNEGGDTAFGVWYSAQNVLVLDTLLIYDRYRPEGFSAVADHSGVYGMFTSDLPRALPPSGSKEFRADVHNSRIGSVSHILGGVQMVEISYVYWDNSPQRRYEETEFFIVDDDRGFTGSHARVADLREGQYWTHKIEDLKLRNAISEMDVLYPDRELGVPLPSDWGPFKTLIVVKSGRTYQSYPGFGHQYNSWRDTLVVFDSSLVPIDSVRSILLHRARPAAGGSAGSR